jgi:hypothetical protein
MTYLPIDDAEKRQFDAIDGTRTFGQVASVGAFEHPSRSGIDIARSQFERLWWYDQVVFDARTPNSSPDLAGS